MGIQIGLFDLEESLLEPTATSVESIDDAVLDSMDPSDRRRRSARRAVEYLMEKRRLRRQLSDFVLQDDGEA